MPMEREKSRLIWVAKIIVMRIELHLDCISMKLVSAPIGCILVHVDKRILADSFDKTTVNKYRNTP